MNLIAPMGQGRLLSLAKPRSALVFTLMTLLAWTLQATERQQLHGHRPTALTRLQSVGRLPATNQIKLAIGLPLRSQEGLNRFLRQLYDPASPQFRHYLTPGQFTASFGPTEEDYQAVIRSAGVHGLSVTGTHPNRMLLDVEGSVADIERTFQLHLHLFNHPQEPRQFYAPDREPSLDSPAPVCHISGLNDYSRPSARHFREDPFASTAPPTPRAGSGKNGAFRGNDFRAAYVPGTALAGFGQSVGLVAFDGFFAADITAYASQAGLPNVPLHTVLLDGFNGIPTSRGPDSGNEEVALDIEMVISMAPGLAQVLVYEAAPNAPTATVDDLLNRMATDNLARQLSCSWGFDIDVIAQQIFLQYAAQGQSFFLASGDQGAFVGAVQQPADDPYITVVGGTVLTTDARQAWSSEYAWQGSGGGASTLYPIPLWQQGIGMLSNQGSSTMRNLPDVAMVAANVLIRADNGRSFTGAGTSIATPLWAGFTALVNEQAAASGKAPIGFLNPAISRIGQGPNYTNCFHDIITGNNTNVSSPDRFFAVAGYDLCTGWGTPNGTNLINALLAPTTEPLLINPPLGLVAAGPIGGPFNPTTVTYSLTNLGAVPLNWTAATTSSWLTVSPSSGTLTPGGPATLLTVTLNAGASNLLLDTFSATISFTNLNDGVGQDRPFSLLVGNGGFETGNFTNWTLTAQTDVNFAASIDYSQFTSRPTIAGFDDRVFVHSGLYGAFLGQNTSLGILSQTLPTFPGRRYRVSFWLANPAGGLPNEFRVGWGGHVLFDQTNLEAFGWTNLQFIVTAPRPGTLLEFAFRNDPNAFGLDEVTVEPIESPQLITRIDQDGPDVSLTFAAAPGIYSVESKDSLTSTDAAWQTRAVLTNNVQGTLQVADPGAILATPQRFYHIVSGLNREVISDPAGYYSLPLNSGANALSMPLSPIDTARVVAANIHGNTVAVNGNPGWLPNAFAPINGSYQYLLVVLSDTGAAAGSFGAQGDWWPILGNASNSVTVDPRADNLAALLAAGSSVAIRKLSSLKDLFGSGRTLILNPDRDGTAVTGDASRADVIRPITGTSFGPPIFVHDGSLLPPGYYVGGNGPFEGSTLTLLPDQTFILFRPANSAPTNLVVKGAVNVRRMTHYLQPGANPIGIPFAAAAPIGASNLKESGWKQDSTGSAATGDNTKADLFRPLDGTSFGAPIFYHNGTLGSAGWYAGGTLNNDYALQPGRAYVFFLKWPNPPRWRQAVPYAL